MIHKHHLNRHIVLDIHDNTIHSCRKERKELSKQRKARGNKNFALIEEVVGLWETLRRHDIEAEERKQLVSKVLKKIDQRIAELSGNHSASRVVQACIKYGSTEDRQKILKEVQPRLLELSKSPYGHFVVSKLIDVSPKNELPGKLLRLFVYLLEFSSRNIALWSMIYYTALSY